MSDDEIKLDFSKITRLFKRKKSVDVEIKEEKEKIKGLKAEDRHLHGEIKGEQKKLHDLEKEKKHEKPEETVSIDFSKIFTLIKKYHIVLLIILVIVLQLVPNEGFLPWGGVWMRMQGQNIPQAVDWGTNGVHNFFKNQIKTSVDQEYPNLPDAKKEGIIEERFEELLEENGEMVNQQIDLTANELKSKFQYEHEGETYTYMPDIDPYYYLRFTRNIEEKGHAYDEVKDGVPWDTHTMAPLGVGYGFAGFHPFVLFYIYKIMHAFDSKIDLMQATAYFSIIFVLLALIPAFLIGRRFAGSIGGFFTASMVALCTAGFGRTPWGHADTDAYNIFFPLLIMWLFIEMFSANNLKKKLVYGALTGVAIGFYSAAWTGWWYVFDFLLAALGIYFIYLIMINRKNLQKAMPEIKEFVILSVFFFIISGLFVSLLMSVPTFINAPLEPIKFMTIKAAAQTTLWPNVYTTVAELNPSSIKSVINAAGGNFLFAIAVLGMILVLLRKDENGKYDVKYSALLAIWFIGTIYAATKGTRFTLLLAPAFSVAFGASLGILHDKITRWVDKEINIQKGITSVVLVIMFALLFIGPAKADYSSAKSDLPIINDAWYASLTEIDEKAAPDAIVNSWWDFGHHFKYLADRAVTFDGASQNTPMAHWIGHVLLTDNEKEAVGILRMLDCGSNTAFDKLFEETEDYHKSIGLLYDLVVLDKDEAKAALEDAGIDDADEVLKYTHCDPPENYFITSEDMISKAGVWAHFGGWNFESADIWINLRKLSKDKMIDKLQSQFGYDEEQAEDMYYEVQAIGREEEANSWISPWPGYATGVSGCRQDKNELICDSGLKVNTDDYSAIIQVQEGEGIPQSVIYVDENKSLAEKKVEGANAPVSAVLIPTASGYNNILCDPKLAKSMFTRLFFMDGHGLEHFELFSAQRQVTGGMIYVWKVNWDGAEPRIHKDLVEKTIVSTGDKVSANYIGWLEDETVFDSSIVDWREKNITKDSKFSDFETKQLAFEVGAGQMIKGFDEAVVDMKPNEIKTVKIDPEDAYGTGTDHPLGNKTLNFKIHIAQIK